MYYKFSHTLKKNGFIWLNYFHTSRFLRETHYDILKLSRNCTSKEIKESFIKLSKEYHPDSKNVNSSQKNFVKLVEAYNILSKPTTRRSYDLGLSQPPIYKPPPFRKHYEGFHDDPPPRRNPWDDPAFYSNRDKSQDRYYEGRPYYGIKGVRKMSNGTVAIICFLIAFSGVILQMAAIRYSVTLKREAMIEESNRNEHILIQLKREVEENGNAVQIERFKERLRNNKYTMYKPED